MAQLPTQSQFGDYSDWPGRDVLDSGGQRFGGVREIYLDRETGRPEWVLVDLTDSEARFVPLANADVDSSSIRVAHDAEKIRSAPGIGAEPRIDQSEERRLYAHYGLAYSDIDRGSEAPPAPTGWGGDDDSPSWQARGGESGDSPTSSDTAASPPSAYEQPATFESPPPAERTFDTAPTPDAESAPPTASAPPLTPPWRTEAEPSNDAPPAAAPPSPDEIESAHMPEEPPASSDRATDYETAPFGAVAPPSESADEPPTSSFAPPTNGSDAPPADLSSPLTDDADTPALTPHAAAPELDPPALAAPIDAPSTLTPPTISHGADSPAPPPVTADTPVADETPKPSWASSPPPLVPEPTHPGALERAKRSPGTIAVAAVAAAVLFFIVRRLR